MKNVYVIRFYNFEQTNYFLFVHLLRCKNRKCTVLLLSSHQVSFVYQTSLVIMSKAKKKCMKRKAEYYLTHEDGDHSIQVIHH